MMAVKGKRRIFLGYSHFQIYVVCTRFLITERILVHGKNCYKAISPVKSTLPSSHSRHPLSRLLLSFPLSLHEYVIHANLANKFPPSLAEHHPIRLNLLQHPPIICSLSWRGAWIAFGLAANMNVLGKEEGRICQLNANGV